MVTLTKPPATQPAKAGPETAHFAAMKAFVIPENPTPEDYAAARRSFGHSQASLAEAIGMSIRTIKHRESTLGNVTKEMMLALSAIKPRRKS